MSRTEHHKGIATKIPNPDNKSINELAKELLIQYGENIDDIESFYEDHLEWLTDDYHKTIFYHPKTNALYKLDDTETENVEDTITAKYNADGNIEYELVYYNGGVSFVECLEEAMDELDDNPPSKNSITLQDAKNVVDAWEKLEGDKHHSPKEIQDWLVNHMSPAINKLRDIIGDVEDK